MDALAERGGLGRVDQLICACARAARRGACLCWQVTGRASWVGTQAPWSSTSAARSFRERPIAGEVPRRIIAGEAAAELFPDCFPPCKAHGPHVRRELLGEHGWDTTNRCGAGRLTLSLFRATAGLAGRAPDNLDGEGDGCRRGGIGTVGEPRPHRQAPIGKLWTRRAAPKSLATWLPWPWSQRQRAMRRSPWRFLTARPYRAAAYY